MKAPALKPGDTIGVLSTSSWVEAEDLEKSRIFLEGRGLKVLIHAQASARLHQSAGDVDGKVAAFHELVANPDVKAIIGSRGGNRALPMLDKIDFDLVRNNPKIILGYSDVTSLLNAIYKETGLITFHGPLFRELPRRSEMPRLLDLLTGRTPPLDMSGCTVLREGTAEGRLIGGNLSVLQALSGTKWQPDTTGAILFLEDTGDHWSRYDRMLTHLRLAGWFDGLAGVVFGDFTDTKDNEDRPFGFTLADMIAEHFAGLDIPIVTGAPFGHGERRETLPVGGTARLDAGGQSVTLALTEPAVA